MGKEILTIVADWVNYLRRDKLWGNDDPLFPATLTKVGDDHQFHAIGLKKEHWRTAAPIRGIFREAFLGAALLYFNPYSLRNTLVQLGETVCRTAEEFKAWSQNMGHEGVLTTFSSYGAVSTARQGELIRSLVGSEAPLADISTILVALARKFENYTECLSTVHSTPPRG